MQPSAGKEVLGIFCFGGQGAMIFPAIKWLRFLLGVERDEPFINKHESKAGYFKKLKILF